MIDRHAEVPASSAALRPNTIQRRTVHAESCELAAVRWRMWRNERPIGSWSGVRTCASRRLRWGLLLSTADAHAQERRRIAGHFPEDLAATSGMEIFETEVEEMTGGEIQFDLFPAMQLGGA